MQTCLLIELFLAVFANLFTQSPFYKYILPIRSSSCRLCHSWYRMCMAAVIMNIVESFCFRADLTLQLALMLRCLQNELIHLVLLLICINL